MAGSPRSFPKAQGVPAARLAGPILVPKTPLLRWLILFLHGVFITIAAVTNLLNFYSLPSLLFCFILLCFVCRDEALRSVLAPKKLSANFSEDGDKHSLHPTDKVALFSHWTSPLRA